jgi:hypothetical protein
MAYAFAKTLTDEPILTPSLLLKLEGISLFAITNEDFSKDLLQAKIEGKSLDEALAQLHLKADGGWQSQLQLKPHTYFVQASKTVGTKIFFSI